MLICRYGLPVNFQAAIVEPTKNSYKKLRAELYKLYVHLDASAAGPIDVSVFFLFNPYVYSLFERCSFASNVMDAKLWIIANCGATAINEVKKSRQLEIIPPDECA